ncbi:hypothetical protein [Candidatus Parabeggiatoa sp. HSG14]|uniref:hypothetical protein n=1 Tax=Candidatus Parabeggiatoa sp. HSG14 TaxID=3055593 RepID=UPI0025A79E1F|nr:hypothetical protein [Thiotrichales bacterium HSG14]
MPKNNLKTSNITTIDWYVFIKPLIVLSLSIIMGIVIILSSQQYHNSTTEWKRQQNTLFGNVEKKYTQLNEALEIVNSLYLEKLKHLKKDGFLNESLLDIKEQRVKIFDKIVTFLKLQKKLFDVSYDFSKTKSYSVPDFLTSISQFKIYQIKINLKFGFLHEGDLLKLIKTIEFQLKSKGLFNLQTCDIKRIRDIINVKDVSQPYFEASCVVVWYVSKIEE